MIIMFTSVEFSHLATNSDLHTWQDDGTGTGTLVPITPDNLIPSISAFQGDGNYANTAVAFGKASILSLLAQQNCDGIRCYFADNGIDEGTGLPILDLVIVGMYLDKSVTPHVLRDLITVVNPDGSIMPGQICDKSIMCPPYCDPTSPLYP
jgi:hypothetical protein